MVYGWSKERKNITTWQNQLYYITHIGSRTQSEVSSVGAKIVGKDWPSKINTDNLVLSTYKVLESVLASCRYKRLHAE